MNINMMNKCWKNSDLKLRKIPIQLQKLIINNGIAILTLNKIHKIKKNKQAILEIFSLIATKLVPL